MKLQILSIKDRALDAFMRPFYAQTEGQGERMFTDLVNEPGSDMNKHPDDYDLYLLGDWNDSTGLTRNHKNDIHDTPEGPKLICRAIDVIKQA